MLNQLKEKYQKYSKLSFMSIFFVAVSLLSVTFAWFAFSGLVSSNIDVNVKAWYIEFKKGDTTVSNQFIIPVTDLEPGMELQFESIDINNIGDDDATLSYEISYARIFDDEYSSMSSEYSDGKLEDMLAHDYPFHINISKSTNTIGKQTGTGHLDVSVSWPLDSGNDEADTEWGLKALDFVNSENEKFNADNNYVVRNSLQIIIKISAEQLTVNNESYDIYYPLGRNMMYDISENKLCTTASSTCINTYVIDTDNKIGDSTVRVIPYAATSDSATLTDYANFDSVFNSLKGNYNVEIEKLKLEDLLNIISRDIRHSELILPGLSPQLIGNLTYPGRLDIEKIKATGEAFYAYDRQGFDYISTANCIWLDNDYFDDSTKAFAFNFDSSYVEGTRNMIYGKDKTESCKVLPVLVLSKNDLN